MNIRSILSNKRFIRYNRLVNDSRVGCIVLIKKNNVRSFFVLQASSVLKTSSSSIHVCKGDLITQHVSKSLEKTIQWSEEHVFRILDRYYCCMLIITIFI